MNRSLMNLGAYAALLTLGGMPVIPIREDSGAEREHAPSVEPAPPSVGTSKYMPHFGAKQRAKLAKRTSTPTKHMGEDSE